MLRIAQFFTPTLLLVAAACQVGGVGSAGNGGGDDDDDSVQCDGPLGAPRDPETLPACCTEFVGNAHCLGDDVVPSELHDFLGACDGGGYCVPDKFIETGGVFTPKACTSLQDAPGVCLSGCIPQVESYWGILPVDVCDEADEKCVPCTNPIDDTDTGACAISYECGDPDPFGTGDDDPGDGGGGDATCPHVGPPVIEPSTLPACPSCSGAAHCLSSGLVPADFAGQLASCDASSLCVPDSFIAAGGNFIPPTCQSVGGAEGRCLSSCLPDVAAQAALLPQATCAAGELCAPCFNPLDGTPTGACNLSCDPGPASGPQALPACCDGAGTCVPPAAAGDQADRLGQDACPDDLLCAPDVFISGDFTPPTCETGLIQVLFGSDFAEGRCLPECLPDVDNFLIGQDDCDDGFKCAPCLNPLTGEPSGACDPI
ncbi:MAG TPA: hypothetical protein VL172_00405 [Kofleriaceae bacterium]|nr:hypothetical protein [Kofleriaceae bacterium]